MQTDPVFETEQHCLSETYAKLQSMATDLTAKMDKNSQDAAQDKLALYQELSPNFASYSDAMETYADFATLNRVIDAYNITQSIDAERLANIRVLLKQPYFAKIILQFAPEEEAKELYIGAVGMSDEMYRRMVVDWRSAVAEVYYNQENGPTSYQAHGRTIEVDLKLRRQFNIEADKLYAYFDTNIAIQDSLLLASLTKQRTAHMQAITATIQKEQNLVIRHEDVPALLVNGVAGSGKTSVLMQRIAYLFYRQRGTLNPQELVLITPNRVFRHYVENVLPDLGESNPECLTWEEFMQGLIPPARSGGSATIKLENLDRIDRICEHTLFEERDFKELSGDKERLLSLGQIRQVVAKYEHIPSCPHRIALIREELLKRLDARLAQIAASEKIFDKISAFEPHEQLKFFHENFDTEDEDRVRILARQYVNARYGEAYKAIENDDWLRIDRIGMRLLGVENLSSVEWIYLKMALTGLTNPSVKYVMVDEVQDYTAAQLAVLARYYKRAHFLLLGDENQTISPHTVSFDEVRFLFQKVRGSLAECRLMTSYRSSSEITEMFASLLGEKERLRISSIHRSDTTPTIIECENARDYDCKLRHAIKQAKACNEGLSAILVPQKHAAKQLQKKLGDNTLPLIGSNDALPPASVVLIPLKLAKGLEFDHVIIPDASAQVFPDDALSRKRLYTSISRATRSVTLLSQGSLSPLLREYSSHAVAPTSDGVCDR